MKRSSKQEDVQYKDFSDLSGGWNCRTEAKDIEDNQIADVTNMTYAEQPGRLRVRKGIGTAIKTFTNNIEGMFAWHEYIILRADGHFWHYQTGDTGPEKVSENSALGTGTPYFCEYDGNLYTCADSKIQKISVSGSTWTLTTIDSDTHAPDDALGLFAKEGRLCCWCSGKTNADYKDYIRCSCVGDADSSTAWTTDSTSSISCQEYQIGYKFAGSIVAVVPFLKDLVVFKGNGIFRFTGTIGGDDAAIYEVARNERLANKDSAKNIGGYLMYLDKLTGARMIQGVDTYGDLLPDGIIPNVNPYIRDNIDSDSCKIWHLKHNKIILFGIGNELIPAYYEYGFDKLPCLKWEFNDTVVDVCETDDGSYFIAIGKKMFRFAGELDEGNGVKCYLATRKLSGITFYLLKRLLFMAESETSTSIPLYTYIYCNNIVIARMIFASGSDDVYNNDDSIYMNISPIYDGAWGAKDFSKHQLYRTRDLQIIIDNTNENNQYAAPFTLQRLAIEYVPVGVMG